jgi:hypothetical protein
MKVHNRCTSLVTFLCHNITFTSLVNWLCRVQGTTRLATCADKEHATHQWDVSKAYTHYCVKQPTGQGLVFSCTTCKRNAIRTSNTDARFITKIV